jgi:Zn-dependent metalloprotease
MKPRKTLAVVGVFSAILATAAFGGATSASAGPAASPLANPAQLTAAALTAALKLGSQERLVVRDTIIDADGTQHLRYDRTYAGLRVLGGDLVVHQSSSGAIRSVDKASRATLTLPSVTPKIAAPTAAANARSTAGDATVSKAAPQLVVYAAAPSYPPTSPKAATAAVLAWETTVTGIKADQTPSRLHVVSDASSGKVLSTWDEIETGTGSSLYSGTVGLTTTLSGSTYQLKDGSRGNQQTSDLNGSTSGSGTLFTDADDVWGSGTTASRQTAGVDAQFGASQTWDYYKNVHGRNGIRNNGVGAASRVHYGNAYANAFWDDSCFCMTYGDGSGNVRPLTSLDVAGHEMSHGVTSATANLIYSGESGGLNEATSDIFGTSVEFTANNSSDVGDYLIGEKININGNGTPLRYMDQPSKDGSSKDCWYDGIAGINVHYSSGPANHLFYLLSEGSGAKTINGVSYNSPTCDGSTVTGIGRDKAEKIWYRALTVYFTSSTNYAAARTGTLSAAADLYGATSAEYIAVGNAWAGAGVAAPAPPPTGPYFENTTDVSIPDNGAAVTSSIAVTGLTGNAPSDLAVGVDIRHTWRGDLVVDLVAPDGSSYRLKSSSGSDSADNVIATYLVNASSEVANGTWTLKVQDVAALDTGYINSFGLTF